MLDSETDRHSNLGRVKPGALDRMGVYAERYGFARVLLLFSQGLDARLMERLTASLQPQDIQILQRTPVESVSFEMTSELFHELPGNADAIIGFGGGKAAWMSRRYMHFFPGFPISLCRRPSRTTAFAVRNPVSRLMTGAARCRRRPIWRDPRHGRLFGRPGNSLAFRGR